MATGFNDALQLFQGGTGGTSTTGDNTLVLPEGSETLSDLIKLNYDFPVEPNVPLPPSYNIYIWNNNNNGEIRFYTKDAKNNNDYNKDFFSGNYSEPRLNFNTKIGKDGKLYYWHNYTTATNPTKLSGWYELDSNFNSIDAQLIILETGIGANSILINNLLTAVADIVIVDNTQTGNITTLFTNIGVIETRLTYLETDNTLDEFAGYSPVSVDYEAISEAVTQRREVQRLITQAATIDRQTALREVNAKYGSTLSSFINSSIQSIAGLGLIAAVFVALREISDNQKKTIYEDEMVAINNSLSIIPVSLSNNTINHTGLTIVSGNGGFPPASLNKEFSVPIQRNAVLKFGIDSSLNAYIIVVDKAGDTYFTVGESISINKNLINGGTGTLVLTVSSLGTLKEWTELKTTYLQNKVNKINTKNRRKNLVVGHDDVNTDQFTNVNATYTDYDEQGAETITYKVLKSRINLLPSGVGDVDLYTATGKVGIGTTPSTKLHIFDNLTNETKITIQNTSNILLTTPSSASIDLNITDNAVIDYNVGNYNGNFKVISKNGGSPTDQIVINSDGRVGIGTAPSEVHKLYVNGAVFSDRYIGYNVNIGKLSSIDLNVYKATNPTIRIESDEGGTPIIEFMKGTNTDIIKDYRFISESETFKLQYQDNITLYDNTINQLLWVNDTNTTIYKPTEFKANVLIGGNTKTIGYVGIGTTAATALHVYNAAANILRLQTAPVYGTNSIEFVRGTLTDPLTDYRLFTDTNGKFKIQYGNNDLAYGATDTDLIELSTGNTIIYKPTEFKGNIGIGTAPNASYNLDIYNQSSARIRLQSSSDSGATSSIEFRKGVVSDVWSDYRLINDNSTFKLQYENNGFAYGDATNIITWNNTNVVNYIPTRFNANVGVKTDPHATYALDVLGDIQATAFRGDGANITNLNQNNLTLTTSKIYERCEPKTFIINPSDKIDIPPVYSFNITAYDRLANTTATYLEAGKFTCTYEDRNGTYKLIPSYIPNTANKVLLNYRVGDKITFKNTANTQYDYTEVPAVRWARLSVFKMPSNVAWTGQGQQINDMTSVFDWDSDSSIVLDWTGTNVVSYPRQTPVTMQIEAGFKYFFVKWQRNNDPSISDSYITPASEISGMNIAYGGGQGFKISGDYSGSGGYKPMSSMLPPLMTEDTAGTARRGARLSLDNTTGTLSADIPLSSDLITVMNTSHFTNNLTTNKIEINSSYKPSSSGNADTATKLQTARTIGGTSFDGTLNIAISYDNLTNKPTIPAAQINSDWNATTGLAVINNKPTLFSGSYTDLSNKPTIPAAQINSDWNATTGLAVINNKPTLFSGNYTDLTNKPTIPAAQINSDWNATTGLAVINNKPTIPAAQINSDWNATTGLAVINNKPSLFSGSYTDLTNKPTIPAAQINSDWNATTGLAVINNKPTIPAAQINSDWNATTGLAVINNKPTIPAAQVQSDWNATTGLGVILNKPTILTMTDINYTSNYVTRINTELTTAIGTAVGTLQPIINSTAGQLIIGNGNGLTTTNAGLTWAGGTTNTLTATNLTTTNLLTTPNLSVTTYATITQQLTSILNGGVDMFELRNNATNNLRFNQTWLAANDMRWQLIQKSNGVDYPLINFRNGNISVGTYSNPAYKLELVGDINITGSYRVNGTVYKPANAVLADTATALATSRNIAGVAFNGTADVVVDYSAVNNKPLTLTPTTTNFVLTSGYNLLVPGNVGVGTSTTVANVLQVGAGGRLRISNGSTDYTMLGTIDADGTTNTSIVISGNTRSTNLGNIQYFAVSSGNHIFYTGYSTTQLTIGTTGVNVNNNLAVVGRVGIATAPHATYKLDVLGDINCSGVFRIGGVALANSAWSYNSVDATKLYYNGGNVGIGTTNPTARLHIQNSSTLADPSQGSLYVFNPTNSAGQNSIISNRIGGSAAGRCLYSFDVSGAYGYSILMNGNSSALRFNNDWAGLGTDRMVLANDGALYTTNGVWHNSMEGLGRLHYSANQTTYLKGHGGTPLIFRNGADSDIMSFDSNGFCTIGYITGGAFPSGIKFKVYGSDGNGWCAMFKHPNDTQGIAIVYDGFTTTNSGQNMLMRLPGAGSQFSIYHNGNWRFNCNDGGVTVYTDLYVTGNMWCGFTAVSMSNTDYLCVQQNYGSGQFANNWVRVAFGSFTAFHRCYTDDELYNNDTDENIDLFKNNYMGRVVIATGKIKTDFSRKKATEPEPEPEPEIDSVTGLPKEPIKHPKNEEEEWYSGIDKDGISIEDAIPVVALSRKKKDKRVFGVLGAPKRSTNNKDRLIVNSIGEGAICVSNTNGNIENGDFLQSSDLLGYAEKQDDDLLHNYTIGKATIDCDFQLDSQYYQCHEIENGVRVAFIACSYHCG